MGQKEVKSQPNPIVEVNTLTVDIDDIVVNPKFYSPSTRQSSPISKKEGFVLGSPKNDLRLYVEPILGYSSGSVGQLVMKYPDGTHVGTASIISISGADFLLSCAHNFVNVVKSYDGQVTTKALGGFFYKGRDGPHQYRGKFKILKWIIHPKYFEYPDIFDGFDIAIASFERTTYLDQVVVSKDSVWSCANESIKGKKIRIFGYPGEDEKIYKQYGMNGTAFNTFNNQNSNGTIVTYKDLDTTAGQSGSPLALVEENRLVIVGVHVGHCPGKKENVATLLTQDLMKWIERSEKLLWT